MSKKIGLACLRKFKPTDQWQRVEERDILPPGCEIRMSVGGGFPEARLRPVKPLPKITSIGLTWKEIGAGIILGALLVCAFLIGMGALLVRLGAL